MTWDGKLQKNRKFLSVLLHQEILKLFLTQNPANIVTINFLLFAWKQTKKPGFTEVWNCCKKQNSLVRVLAVIGIGFSLYLQDKNIFRNKKFQLYLYFFIESISGFISSTAFFLSFVECFLLWSFWSSPGVTEMYQLIKNVSLLLSVHLCLLATRWQMDRNLASESSISWYCPDIANCLPQKSSTSITRKQPLPDSNSTDIESWSPLWVIYHTY